MRRAIQKAMTWSGRVLRVTSYFAVVCAILGVLAARSAIGAVKDAALEMGGELARLGDALGPASHVRLNGERVNVASAMSDAPIADVLDRAEAMCRERANIGVIRRESRDHDRGIVACLARDGGSEAIARDVADFVATGDLSKVGKLRYVVAEKSGAGTHVVTAWTDGAFRLGAMFPREGDAPGSDLEDTTRPDRAKRLLTASVENAPYSVRIYDVAATASDVLAQYAREMPERGWEAIPGVAKELKTGLAFSRNGIDLMVLTQADGDHAIVSVVEMPPPSGAAKGGRVE